MIILGIDPGTAIMGYGIIDYVGNKFTPMEYSAIRTSPNESVSTRLRTIYQKLIALIKEYQPDFIAIEELFFNKNVKTALAVGQARGVAILAAANNNIPVFEYTPLQVKQAVVGNGRAEKSQVQYMVKTILALDQTPKPDDVADALAVAICHAHSNNILEKIKMLEDK